ncbi:unnamed protein product [Eruca vesicaria subsp. sativa]|uniref:GRF-type domain-containing protein n=1 Tax=Eruca vesicaria subsp. sativa TaxID=29727 RepID=A0ABC8JPM4_ERUVS|nr:unnamed protein product [Eruca vesicaria subsp. sativa]
MKAEISCPRRKRDFLHGIPSHCWCGNPISVFVSKTTRNPFRRFYRCEEARMREGETHLFKWFDEALVEEILIVEARQTTIKEDLEAWLLQSLVELVELVKSKRTLDV